MPPRKPEPVPAWRNALSLAKDALPWLLLLVYLIYTAGTTQSQLDQQKQRAQEARADMERMQQQILDLTSQEATLAAKVDVLIHARK